MRCCLELRRTESGDEFGRGRGECGGLVGVCGRGSQLLEASSAGRRVKSRA